MTKNVMQELNDVSADAVTALKRYFHAAIEPGEKVAEDKKLPDRALIMLGRINGVESTRLKGIALQFQIAKFMGMQGEPLRPLLAELSPDNFASAPAGAIAATLAPPAEKT